MGVPSVDITGSTSGGSDRKGFRQPWRPPTRPKTQKQATKPAKAAAGGGGGGRSSAADKRKAFINYYRRYLNIKPNMALVERAVKGDYTMAEFQLLVQREDTDRFIKTWKGQETLAQFRSLWARIFPSLNRQPGIKSLRLYLKQRPAKSYRDITNPVTIRDMYAWLSKKPLFKKLYPRFANTEFLQTLNFAGYRQYSRDFRRILRNYLGRYALYPDAFPKRAADNANLGIGGLTDEVSYFFDSRISPAEFEKNLQTYLAAMPAYMYAGERPLTNRETREAVFGRRGGASVLKRLASAYERYGAYMQSQPARYQMERQQIGPSTVNVY